MDRVNFNSNQTDSSYSVLVLVTRGMCRPDLIQSGFKEAMEKLSELITFWVRKSMLSYVHFKGTLLNQSLPSLHGESFNIMLTIPLINTFVIQLTFSLNKIWIKVIKFKKFQMCVRWPLQRPVLYHGLVKLQDGSSTQISTLASNSWQTPKFGLNKVHS